MGHCEIGHHHFHEIQFWLSFISFDFHQISTKINQSNIKIKHPTIRSDSARLCVAKKIGTIEWQYELQIILLVFFSPHDDILIRRPLRNLLHQVNFLHYDVMSWGNWHCTSPTIFATMIAMIEDDERKNIFWKNNQNCPSFRSLDKNDF